MTTIERFKIQLKKRMDELKADIKRHKEIAECLSITLDGYEFILDDLIPDVIQEEEDEKPHNCGYCGSHDMTRIARNDELNVDTYQCQDCWTKWNIFLNKDK